MEPFKVSISCNKCGSLNVEIELAMNQGVGLMSLECNGCGNMVTHCEDDISELKIEGEK